MYRHDTSLYKCVINVVYINTLLIKKNSESLWIIWNLILTPFFFNFFIRSSIRVYVYNDYYCYYNFNYLNVYNIFNMRVDWWSSDVWWNNEIYIIEIMITSLNLFLNVMHPWRVNDNVQYNNNKKTSEEFRNEIKYGIRDVFRYTKYLFFSKLWSFI